MTGVELLGIAAAGLSGIGLIESLTHRKHLKSIPLRIHVSGTRGKSSVTRLISAGLRKAGIVTCAKTTGTLARMILPDGKEVPVFRPSGANIIEQRRIVSVAKNLEVQAIVIECMALLPELHWLSENKLIRATHAVITNVRADHLDIMGPTEGDVALTLAGMIPVGGVLVTGERKHLDVLRKAADDRKTKLICVSDDDLNSVRDSDLTAFRYLEHRENVAVALKMLQEVGVPRDKALAGMWEAAPDPGALTEHHVNFFGRRLVFVNAFAANDPQSTETIWRIAKDRHPDMEKTIAVFNLRADRPSRTIQLAQTRFWHEADHVVLMGSGAYLFVRAASLLGVDLGRFVFAEHNRLEEVFESIVEVCDRSNLIIGMANIGGQGLGLVKYFRNRQDLSFGEL